MSTVVGVIIVVWMKGMEKEMLGVMFVLTLKELLIMMVLVVVKRTRTKVLVGSNSWREKVRMIKKTVEKRKIIKRETV